MYLFTAQSDLAALPLFNIILPGYVLISSGLTHLFTLYWTFPQYVSICSWTCIYLIMAQSDLVALPPRNAWIFVLSVSAMLIVFLMYVNKSVHMYISTFTHTHTHIYIYPHTHKHGHVYICMEKKVSWYCILLYMTMSMNMFTIKISKVIWQV